MTKAERDFAATEVLYRRYRKLEERARAIVEAGRPHDHRHLAGSCPQCAAWDALKALLEEKT